MERHQHYNSHLGSQEPSRVYSDYHQMDRDDKMHAPHATLPLNQRLRDAVWAFRHTQVPLSAVCLICMLCVYAGTFVKIAEVLPSPTGELMAPKAAVVGGSRRTLLVVSEDGAKEQARDMRAVSKAVIREAQDVAKFENVSLHMSGYDTVRPALTPAESGEEQMRAVPFQVISWYPRIIYYPSFVDPARCEQVVASAKKRLFPSSLAYKPGDSIPETQEVRTSSGTFMGPDSDSSGAMSWIEAKIAAVTHLPIEYGEAFNVLRYEPSQHYDSHYDTFDPKDFGQQYSQRIATFLIFLRAPEEGGETVFKREGLDNGNRTIDDWRTCSDGLGIKVKPKQGDAVLFYSTTPDLQLDPHSLHGACPVVKGEKWSAAKWLHEKPINGLPRKSRRSGKH